MNRKLNQFGVTSHLYSFLGPKRAYRVPRMLPPRIQMKSYSQQSSQPESSQAQKPQPETGRPQTEQSQAESSQAERPSSGTKGMSPLLAILLVAGIGATAFGIYDMYGMLTMWPTEVRTDLRGAMKARNKGNLDLSERFLRRAWETSKILPVEAFKKEPYLKISGIGILLGSVLEAEGKHDNASHVYLDTLTRLQKAGEEGQLSGPEKLRAIAISYKLGELASVLKLPEEQERHLVWAVEAILKSVFRLGEETEHQEQVKHPEYTLEAQSAVSSDPDTRVMLSELSLPPWATKTDVAAPLEALGTFYAQAGRLDYAMPLYLQAISVLVPPSAQQSSDEDRCRGAQLMSNLSELIIRSQPELTEETLKQAEAWAKKGLEIAKHTKERSSTPDPTCEIAFAVALFNIATLRQMAGDKEEAKKLFSLSLDQSEAIGLEAGVQYAKNALRQLAVPSDAPPPPSVVPAG